MISDESQHGRAARAPWCLQSILCATTIGLESATTDPSSGIAVDASTAVLSATQTQRVSRNAVRRGGAKLSDAEEYIASSRVIWVHIVLGVLMAKNSALSIDDLLSSCPVHKLGADVRFQILFPSTDRKSLRDWFGRDLTAAALLTFRLGPSIRQLAGRIEYASPSRPACVQ